jgi:hypothetical protein
LFTFKTRAIEGEIIEIGVSIADQHGRNYHHIKIQEIDGTISTIPDLSVSFAMTPNIAINNCIKLGIAGRKGSYFAVVILCDGIVSCLHVPKLIISRVLIFISILPLIMISIEFPIESIFGWIAWFIAALFIATRRAILKARKRLFYEITAGENLKKEVVY